MTTDFGAMQDYQDFGRFAERYSELTHEERAEICEDCLDQEHDPAATRGEACVLWEEWKRGNIDTDYLRPFFGPREYVVTQTVERKVTVKALCLGDAIKKGEKACKWDEEVIGTSAARKLPKPRCQMHIFEETDYDIDENFDMLLDRAAARKYGLVGYYIEVAHTMDVNDQPIWTTDDCDSCTGFIKRKHVIDHIFETAELPEGITRKDVEIYFEGNQL